MKSLIYMMSAIIFLAFASIANAHEKNESYFYVNFDVGKTVVINDAVTSFYAKENVTTETKCASLFQKPMSGGMKALSGGTAHVGKVLISFSRPVTRNNFTAVARKKIEVGWRSFS